MVTSSVRGHLINRDFPQQFGWSSCSPSALFDAPIESNVSSDMHPLLEMLQKESRKADALILWLDCDREGEAIAAEVREVCTEANPRLNANKVFRAKFSTVLPQEIYRALRSLGRVNEAFVHAVEARSELDLRVGAAFTRFQTLRLQKRFDGLQNGVISYGPCQFPTLGFIVERWARIETFIPDEFWFIEMQLRLQNDRIQAETEENFPPNDPSRIDTSHHNAQTVNFTWKRTRLYDRLLTLVLYESCLEAGEAVVTSMTGRPKNRWRPIPLATVDLQKRASKYLRIGSETLMSAAEELYQQGYISYPRTETERFRPEFEHLPLIQSFQTLQGEFGDYATKLLSDNNFQNPRAGQNDDKAHPPITPCKAVNPQDISNPTNRDVYILIVKHYLACCSRDAVGKETEISVKIASEEFNAKGLIITDKNWLEIYAPWERWSTGQGELPNVLVGSRIVPSALLMKEGVTTPPAPISEVELISLMDKNGIGTDATIATHISTIQTREYAQKDPQQRFHPTKLGIALIEGYNSMGYQLNKPDLRREMELECNLVASGQKTKDQIMLPILTKMRECFERVSNEAHKLDQAVSRHYECLGASNDSWRLLKPDFSKCGICSNHMGLKESSNSGRSMKSLYCVTCRKGHSLPPGEISITSDERNGNEQVCPICQFQVLRVVREEYGGNGYMICPKCFNDPPSEMVSDASMSSTGGFKCSRCTHPACPLASGVRGGTIELFACPFCAQQRGGGELGKITLCKKGQSFCLGCSSYSTTGCSYTLWLRAAAEASVEADHPLCPTCMTKEGRSSRKLKIVWKPGSVPPHVNNVFFGCILCDSNKLMDAGITLPESSLVTPHQRGRSIVRGGQGRSRSMSVGRSARGRGGRASRTNGRHNNDQTCFKCGRSGHYANACPG